MKGIRPLLASSPVVIPFVAWFWFSTAGIDYAGGNPLLSLRTAGWFILGFPFILGLSCLCVWFTAAMWRRLGVKAPVLIWLALITLLFLSIKQSLPYGRLSRIIGSNLAQNVEIHRLISGDSFGDGTFTLGEFSGTSDTLKRIAEYRALREQEIVPATQFQPLIDDDGDYRTHLAYGDCRSIFFLSPKTNTIYFRHESEEPPGP